MDACLLFVRIWCKIIAIILGQDVIYDKGVSAFGSKFRTITIVILYEFFSHDSIFAINIVCSFCTSTLVLLV